MSFPLRDDGLRLAEIGPRAAKLCYQSGCPADSICTSSCAAVVPDAKFLDAAAQEIFREYWEQHQSFLKMGKSDA